MMPKLRSTITWTLALGLLIAGAAGAASLEETFDQTFAFGAGDLLELENTNGTVGIEAWDRQEIHILATKKVKASSSERAEEAMRELEIRVETGSGRIRVETLYPQNRDRWFSNESSSVHYEIKLPALADLDVRTVNGNVKIDGISGDLELGTTNGNVTVADSGGRLDARTTNGSISAELGNLTVGEDMVFRTTNGGITLAIPADAQASLTARTTNGSIKTDFPVVVEGDFSHHRLEGELNGGGGKVELRTTNGSIRILEL